MPAAGILLRVLAAALTFSQASAFPWTVEKCNGNAAPSSPLDLSSCCRWSGDSDGASMHPASASASCSDARAPCGLAASPDGHARTLGLSASGVCAGAPLVRTGSCPGFTGFLDLYAKNINLINPDAFVECGATVLYLYDNKLTSVSGVIWPSSLVILYLNDNRSRAYLA